ncbi:Sodium channel protein, partial [Caligus rogercresseyi]
LIARGFLLDNFTYLRDAWNWLDFSVIGMSYITIAVDLGSFSALRTFRVFRALKSVAVIPGLKTIVSAIIYSVKNLRDVIILTMFALSVFALLGLQIYMGVLSQKCIYEYPLSGSEEFEYWGNMTAESFNAWYSNKSSWYLSSTGNYIMHAMHGRLRAKPQLRVHELRHFGSAYLCAFRLMTQDFWENLYQITLRTAGPWHIIFFMCNIFLGSFYLINLILAIVAMSYDELQRLAEEEAQRELEELEAIKEAEEAALAEAEAAAAEAAEAMEGIFGGGGGGAGDPFPESPGRESILSEKLPPDERLSLRSASLSVYNHHRIRQSLNAAGGVSTPFRPHHLYVGPLIFAFKRSTGVAQRSPGLEHLPYADDSTAVTPKSELNGGIVVDAPHRINSINNNNNNNNNRKYSYNSHNGKIDSYNSHTDLSRYNGSGNNNNNTKEGTLRIRMASLFGEGKNNGAANNNGHNQDYNQSTFINNHHERKESIDIQALQYNSVSFAT